MINVGDRNGPGISKVCSKEKFRKPFVPLMEHTLVFRHTSVHLAADSDESKELRRKLSESLDRQREIERQKVPIRQIAFLYPPGSIGQMPVVFSC